MKSREVDWVRFNDGTKIYVGTQNIVKILYHEGHTHYVDVIFDNGDVHRYFGIDGMKFKEALYFVQNNFFSFEDLNDG